MTLIATWVAMDDNKEGKKPSSLYLAADSRITYLDNSGTPIRTKDEMQKIFLSSKHPEMFAICGDYDKCKGAVTGLIHNVDEGDFLLPHNSVEEKVAFIKNYFKSNFKPLLCNSVILYGTRVKDVLSLHQFIISDERVEVKMVPLGNSSRVVSWDGSGKKEFFNQWLDFNENAQAFNEADTSRGAFRSIYEAIDKIGGPFVGGKMQAAALYRGHNTPHPIGIYYGDDCYLFGIKHTKTELNESVEYRNSNFEIVDPRTGKIADGAQRQPFAKDIVQRDIEKQLPS